MGSVQTMVAIFCNVGKNVVEHCSTSTRFSERLNFIFLLRITRYYTEGTLSHLVVWCFGSTCYAFFCQIWLGCLPTIH